MLRDALVEPAELLDSVGASWQGGHDRTGDGTGNRRSRADLVGHLRCVVSAAPEGKPGQDHDPEHQ